MKAKVFGLVACMAILGPTHANAATLVGTTSDATGIDGLVVDGVTYNVSFDNADYVTAFASIPPTFLGNTSGAEDAATALASAINSLSVVTLSGVTSTYQILGVPTADISGDVLAAYDICQSDTNPCTAADWVEETPTFLGEDDTVLTDTDYAIFTVAATPLPAALPLFAAGLGAMGLLSWRRKRKALAA